MTYQQLLILLPCHSLEDFPLEEEPERAQGLLAGWTALWHPALLAAADRTPSWHRADEPPAELADRLVVVPSASSSLLLAGWADRAEAEGALVIRNVHDRNEIVRQALDHLEGGDPGLDVDLVADFLALGFTYLQVELLTRQMRYMSSIDETHLDNEAVAAAKALVQGDVEGCRQRLTKCFDTLTEARERFYPVEAYLIDLTLIAATTLGPHLREASEAKTPLNLLLSGNVLDEMAANEPASLTAVKRALEEQRASIAGGEFVENELPLSAPETALGNLRRGVKAYREQLGRAPKVFARRRYGLTPVLPQWLSRLGFDAALHCTLDDGRTPRGDQSRGRWEGVDGSAVESLDRAPLDAGRADAFLRLCRTLGETMDMDHVASVVFAHWPGGECCWYDDLRRASRYAPVLGRFVTLDDFFSTTDGAGRLTRYPSDGYRSPYLRQAVIANCNDPISRFTRHHLAACAAAATQAFATLARLLSASATRDEASGLGDFCQDADEEQLRAKVVAAAERFLARVPATDAEERDGVMIANPHSFALRACVELPERAVAPAVGGAVVATQGADGRQRAVVDVPPMGFAWLEPGGEKSSTGKKEKPLAEENVLRNEFVQVVVNRETGGIQSIHDFHTRGNRMSQQLAMRLPQARLSPGEVWRDPDADAVYSVMAADAVDVTSSGPALGEIVSRGRLMHPDGTRLAGFEQIVQVWRGSRVIRLELRLDVDHPPGADPWRSYYACRFAWNDAAAETFRSMSLGSQPSDAQRVEAPHLFDIRGASSRTTILTGGLPYHRRIDMRKLDSLLVVRGEQERRWQLGIAIDVEHPLPSALELMAPIVAVAQRRSRPSAGDSGWLFHCSAKNLVATAWEPLEDGGRTIGFRVRLMETEGRGGRTFLRSFRDVESAWQKDFRGETLSDLGVAGDRITVDFTAHEWVQVEAHWKS